MTNESQLGKGHTEIRLGSKSSDFASEYPSGEAVTGSMWLLF